VNPKAKPPEADSAGGHRGKTIWSYICIAALSLALAFSSPYIPPVLQALLLMFCFISVIALFISRTKHQLKKPPRQWRNTMPCYLSIQDRTLTIIEANPIFERDFGDCIGQKCYSAYKKRPSPCPECPILLTFKDGKTHSSEENVIKKDGSVAQVVVTSSPLYDARGRISSVMEVSTDVTGLRWLENKLMQSRRDYKRLFDSVPCYIVVLDRDLKIVESNALYNKDFGERKGLHCFEVCKSRTTPCPECLVTKTFEDGEMRCKEEILSTRDGKEVDLVVYSMPIMSEVGGGEEVTYTMEVFTDITNVKSLQRQLTLMGRAVAGTAHRIKNILMGLEGGTFVVNEGMETNDQETVAEGWSIVKRNVQKVSTIVKDLLYCAKERELNIRDDVDPREVIQEVHDLFADRLAREEIDLEIDLCDTLPRGRYDPDGLHNLLSNLVANAIDACRFDMTEAKARHTIKLRCLQGPDDAVVFEVEDNGAGIPDDLREKVFKDFFSSKGTEGTGVGLLVVQKVAEEHGGKVTFSSRPEKGTVFRVTIHEAVPKGVESSEDKCKNSWSGSPHSDTLSES